jgi:hypothetical protein
MIVCGQCGVNNESASQFCVSCGAFLEWEGTAASQEPAAAAPSAAASASASASAPTPTPTPAAASTLAAPAPAAVSVPAAASASPTAPAPAPDVVQPGEARRQHRVRVPDEPRQLLPGELPCPQCGAGNDPSPRFGRACGLGLEQVAAPVHRSWWRRLWERLTARRAYEAGTRRKVAAPRGRLRRLLVLAALLAVVVLVVAALPARGVTNRLVTDLQDRLSGHVPLTPVAARASSSAAGAPPARLIDGVSNQYWAPAGAPTGAWVEVDFAQPVRLLDVIVTPGVSADKQRFLAQGRPHELAVAVTNRSGQVKNSTLNVRDEPGGQSFSVKVSDAVRVRLTIASTYGMAPGHRCAIGELEFFVRG